MIDTIIQIVAAAIGCVGFTLLLNVDRRHIVLATVGGTFTWIAYLGLMHFSNNLFLSCAVSAGLATIYAEIMAKVKHSPTTIYLIIALIPLIPGSGLYYTMSNMVQGNGELASIYGTTTGNCALGLAAGMSLVIAFRTLKDRRAA